MAKPRSASVPAEPARVFTTGLAAVLLATMWATGLGCQPQAEEPLATRPVAQVPRVNMEGLRFAPSRITVMAGDTIEFYNTSRMTHTVTADPTLATQAVNVRLPRGASVFNSGNIRPGESYFHTFEVPGTYRYFCIPHQEEGMIGEVTVIDPDGVMPPTDTTRPPDRLPAPTAPTGPTGPTEPPREPLSPDEPQDPLRPNDPQRPAPPRFPMSAAQ